MDMIRRESCVVSGQNDLEHLHTFTDFPVYMGCADGPPGQDLTAPMSWWISRRSGCIQLNPLVPLDVLYARGHGSGTVGGLWARHHEAFCRFILRYSPHRVLEIGGGHGGLACRYLDAMPEAHWTMVEPNPTVPPRERLHVVHGLLDENYRAATGTDAVVHSHLLEHVYHPAQFFDLAARNLQVGGYQLFSIPNMRVMLERKYTNCLNFEHTVFLADEYIDCLLSESGLVIAAKEYFLDDHSVFYAAQKVGRLNSRNVPQIYEWHRDLFLAYVRHHEDLVEDLNRRMVAHDGEVYLFGAHVFTQYLLAFGLQTNRVVCLLDNDPKKQGRRLYGTPLIVASPAVLKHARKPAVVLRAGVYNEEVKQGIRELGVGPVTYWE